MKKYFLGVALVLAFLSMPDLSHATTIAEIQAMINALVTQIGALSGTSQGVSAYVFTKDLTIGSSGADVTTLQNFLISKGFLSSEFATGYFGPLTRASVSAYQTSKGISPADGYFGPVTRANVNADIGSSPVVATSTAPYVSNVTSSVGNIISNSDGIAQVAYPSFVFTLNNTGDAPIYISKVPNTALGVNIVPGELSSVSPISFAASSSATAVGDTPNAFIINGNTSRIFTYNFSIDGSNSSSTVNRILSIKQINYGFNVNNLSAENTTLGTENLTFSVSLGGSSPVNAPSFSITSPKSGDVLVQGSTANITWTGSDSRVSTFAVYLVGGSLGSSGSLSLGNVDANQHSFLWTVPTSVTPGSNYQVQLSGWGASGDNSPSFSIIASSSTSPSSTINVVGPNGGENLLIGQPTTITWTSTGPASSRNVQIGIIDTRYSTEGGDRAEQIIANSIPNTGSYTWNVPAKIGTMDLNVTNSSVYKIIIHSSIDAETGVALSDVSDSSFSISTSVTLPVIPPTIDVPVIAPPVVVTPPPTPSLKIPTLSITSPKTPTTWKKGASKSITWKATNLAGGTTITAYLYKGTDAPIQLFSGGTGGRHTFTVSSSIPDGGYHIRLDAIKDGATVATVNGGTTITLSSPPAKAYNPIGYFDAVNCSVISGWTCDQNDFNTPLRVDVYSGAPAGRGNHVINDTANVKREAGVGARCGGNPAHGFNIPTPPQLKDNKTHDIYVYGINIGPGANKLLGHKKMGKCS